MTFTFETQLIFQHIWFCVCVWERERRRERERERETWPFNNVTWRALTQVTWSKVSTEVISPVSFSQKGSLQLLWNLHISWVYTFQSWGYFSTKSLLLSTHFFHLYIRHLCKTLYWSNGACQTLCFSLSSTTKWHPHCCSCLPCAQTGVQCGIVIQEEDLIHFSGWLNPSYSLF